MSISGVSQAANETGAAAGQVLTAAGGLSEQSRQLSGESAAFVAAVRAASPGRDAYSRQPEAGIPPAAWPEAVSQARIRRSSPN